MVRVMQTLWGITLKILPTADVCPQENKAHRQNPRITRDIVHLKRKIKRWRKTEPASKGDVASLSNKSKEKKMNRGETISRDLAKMCKNSATKKKKKRNWKYLALSIQNIDCIVEKCVVISDRIAMAHRCMDISVLCLTIPAIVLWIGRTVKAYLRLYQK